MRPVHYDVAAMRQQSKAARDAMLLEGQALDVDARSRSFQLAQHRLGVLLDEFGALQAELMNEALPVEVIAGAAGAIVGQMMRSASMTYGDRADLIRCFYRYVADAANNEPANGRIDHEPMTFEPIVGGSA